MKKIYNDSYRLRLDLDCSTVLIYFPLFNSSKITRIDIIDPITEESLESLYFDSKARCITKHRLGSEITTSIAILEIWKNEGRFDWALNIKHQLESANITPRLLTKNHNFDLFQ